VLTSCFLGKEQKYQKCFVFRKGKRGGGGGAGGVGGEKGRRHAKKELFVIGLQRRRPTRSCKERGTKGLWLEVF
jgi:hypothetical protein